MKTCIRCNTPLEEGGNFCPVCGTDQRFDYRNGNGNDSTLKILCILTIIGSVFQACRGMLYELVSTAADNQEYIRGWIYFLTSVATLAGAIMMLQKQLKGLYIYTIGQALYLLTCIWATGVYMQDAGADGAGFVIVIAAMFIVPAVIFLIMFWQNSVRKFLK